jgi:hypothetical protein
MQEQDVLKAILSYQPRGTRDIDRPRNRRTIYLAAKSRMRRTLLWRLLCAFMACCLRTLWILLLLYHQDIELVDNLTAKATKNL